MTSTARPSRELVLTHTAVIRLVLAWGASIALMATRDVLHSGLPGPLLVAVLGLTVAIVVVAAFGVVHEAEQLAHRLGDPYGSLVLTLSIVLIEVVLISSVMLGPGEHDTIARDSVLAVMMIILNLVIGIALLMAGRRGPAPAHNRTGTSVYVGMIALFGTLAFVMPAVTGTTGSYTSAQEIPIVLVTLVSYAWFLIRQTGRQAPDFTDPTSPATTPTTSAPTTTGRSAADTTATSARTPVGTVLREHRTELLARTLLLVATMIPIVLMSHDLAGLLDDGLGRVGAPVALAGILIAIIVFTPESITAIRAALRGETQRVVNLCLGAFVSTVGLTIPAVLVIGLVTDQKVVLAPTAPHLVLVVTTVVTTAITFAAPRVTASHGALHLALFAVYVVTVFTT
ncbi:calcium:proton antiporter [Pseudoclavibacter chungangensis]|uniref:Calcium:proton antiporter n=1 Tax=Pseudoclavibacter chungangensis TaxID=587635 RepID=A0A7J5BZT9_9MICO|nr:calcium:proton antiporter [Pseudoclavibacter chungangensis]KAB1660162.1 calcium:proton antiporter [Pseudoclavibacter chungangensis]NYJ66726.1 Ca2+:H+ antiporter [Pseudoclavibacter chungangensis]